jgi:quinol monooxygenase YgiN
MIVRIGSTQIPPERVDELVSRYRETVRPIHERCHGLRHHYVLVDREGGEVVVVGLWDSSEALEEALPTLEPVRDSLWAHFESAPTLKAFELADELGNP